MSPSSYAQALEARPIKALIIQPDNSYEVREINQDIRSFHELAGGYAEAFSIEHCVFWFDRDGDGKESPCNAMATYLWWKLVPEKEGLDQLSGTVFVTGPTDDASDSTPLPDSVIDLYGRMEQVRRQEEGE